MADDTVRYNTTMHSSIPRIPFTQETLDDMQAEYAALIEQEKDVIVRLQTAREMGDLSENGAYRYAKFELGNTRRRLKELKRMLDRGVVIKSSNNGVVQLGSTVTLKNDDEEMTFTLVSKYESDPSKKKLSDQSPIGRAVMGKKLNDQVVIQLLESEKKLRITELD